MLKNNESTPIVGNNDGHKSFDSMNIDIWLLEFFGLIPYNNAEGKRVKC